MEEGVCSNNSEQTRSEQDFEQKKERTIASEQYLKTEDNLDCGPVCR